MEYETEFYNLLKSAVIDDVALSSFGKLLSKNFGNTTDNSKLKVI